VKPSAVVAAFVIGAGGGGAAGYLIARASAAELEAARKDAAAAHTAAKVESDRADGAQKQIDVLTKAKAQLEAKVATPVAPTPDKPPPVIDPAVGEVAICGDEIHIGVPNYVDRKHLKKLATTLNELPHDTITLRGVRAKTLARQLRAAARLDVATVNEGIEIVIK
jgi:hypothetical protein